jgi:hypothetical protein
VPVFLLETLLIMLPYFYFYSFTGPIDSKLLVKKTFRTHVP